MENNNLKKNELKIIKKKEESTQDLEMNTLHNIISTSHEEKTIINTINNTIKIEETNKTNICCEENKSDPDERSNYLEEDEEDSDNNDNYKDEVKKDIDYLIYNRISMPASSNKYLLNRFANIKENLIKCKNDEFYEVIYKYNIYFNLAYQRHKIFVKFVFE
jgi:hypothetical protein